MTSSVPKFFSVRSFWLELLLVTIFTVLLCSFGFRQTASLNGDLVLHRLNAHDALWHVGLMEAINQGLPPENPLLQGHTLQGYHYVNDVLWVGVHRLTGLSILRLYVQIAPVLLAIIFSASSLWLFKTIFTDRYVSYLAASLVVIGGGLASYAPVIYDITIFSPSAFWLDQSGQYAINQQLLLSFSVINVIFGLSFIAPKKYWAVIGILTGVLAGIKIYALLLLWPALVLVGLYQLIFKKDFSWLKMWAVSLPVGGLIMLIAGNQNGWPFIWAPGWFFKTMYESGSHLNYSMWEIKRQVFALDHNYLRLAIHWGMAAAVFFMGNLGVKILGFVAIPYILYDRLKSKVIEPHLLLWVLLAGGACLAPTLFIQKGVVWNTIQFMHYVQIPIVLLLLTGLTLIIKKIRYQQLILGILVLLALPTTLQFAYINTKPDQYITYSYQTLSQLATLRHTYPDKVILLSEKLANESLVPTTSGRSVYWADQTILDILGQTHQERKDFMFNVETGQAVCPDNAIFVQLNQNKVGMFECPLPIPTTQRVVAN